MFKGLANIGALLKQAQQLGGQMGQLTEEMRRRRVTGSAGGGMVEIEVNGLMEVLRCHIDPQLVAQNDRELLEDLVMAAVNQAISQGEGDARRVASRSYRRPAPARRLPRGPGEVCRNGRGGGGEGLASSG